MNTPGNPAELARIQQWMQSVIMHPEGVEAGLEAPVTRSIIDVAPERVEDVICRSAAQTSVERLHVYANAYYARLLEVLESEFPALVHALGAELFQEFAFGYLQEYPSQSYTLEHLTAKFPEYLAQTRPDRESDAPDWADFLVDLATLERAYSDIFDGPGVEGQSLLSADQLRAIGADRWPSAKLVPVPCLKLLHLRFPVHEYATAVRRKQDPSLPEPASTWLVMTRRDFVVRRVAVNEAEFAALGVLLAGGSIADSLEAAEKLWPGEFDQLVSEVQRWFRDWSAAGYFQSIEEGTLRAKE